MIPSGRSDVARYKFKIPPGVGGQIKLTAALKYRRFTSVFSDYALGKKADLPIVTMATTEFTFNVGSETKASRSIRRQGLTGGGGIITASRSGSKTIPPGG